MVGELNFSKARFLIEMIENLFDRLITQIKMFMLISLQNNLFEDLNTCVQNLSKHTNKNIKKHLYSQIKESFTLNKIVNYNHYLLLLN